MRCQARIRREVKHRKGSGKQYERVRLVVTPYQISRIGVNFPTAFPEEWEKRSADTEECGGIITTTVRAAEEPYMGGVSATFEVEHKCERCGNTYFPMLPKSEEEVSAVLTQWVAEREPPIVVRMETEIRNMGFLIGGKPKPHDHVLMSDIHPSDYGMEWPKTKDEAMDVARAAFTALKPQDRSRYRQWIGIELLDGTLIPVEDNRK